MRRLALLTLVSCYLLVLFGSAVRAAGAGLGCPDWPLCFGLPVPPLSADGLPEDYREAFAVAGRPIPEFDPVKTWMEYANRLLGAAVGLMALVLAGMGLARRRHAALGLGVLALTGAQGLLGAGVVASRLMPSLVTLHAVVAVAILFLLHALHLALRRDEGRLRPVPGGGRARRASARLALLALALALAQLLLGTGVREGVDALAASGVPREGWIGGLGAVFALHRAGAALLLAACLLLAGRLALVHGRALAGRSAWLLASLAAALGGGSALGLLHVPAAVRPLHLLAACLLLGALFELALRLRPVRPSGGRPAG